MRQSILTQRLYFFIDQFFLGHRWRESIRQLKVFVGIAEIAEVQVTITQHSA